MREFVGETRDYYLLFLFELLDFSIAGELESELWFELTFCDFYLAIEEREGALVWFRICCIELWYFEDDAIKQSVIIFNFIY